MKKIVMALLVVIMLFTSYGLMTVKAEGNSEPIIFDFSIEPTYKQVATDPEKGDNWNISWEDGLAFLGKYHLTRVSYSYDNTEKACVFTAHTQTGVMDPYFVASSPDSELGADMPEKYHIDTSQYKIIKILYKAKTETASMSAFHWISDKISAYDDYNSFQFDINTSNEWTELTLDMTESTIWEAAGVIKQLRVGTYRGASIGDNDTMSYKYIAFFKTKADADAYTRLTNNTPVPKPTEGKTSSKADGNGKFIYIAIAVVVIAVIVLAVLLNRKRLFKQ